jgi:hypothetical protein
MIFSRVGGGVTYKTSFGLNDWIYWTLYTQLETTGNYIAIINLHTLLFTVTHVLGYLVFTNRILARDFITVPLSFQITRSLLFLPFILSYLRMPTLSVLSQAHILSGWRLETQLTLLNWTLLYNYFARATEKTQPPYCWEGVFTAPVHSNGSYSIVSCEFVSAGIRLRSRCLAMNVYSDFTIPTFGRHVTILLMQLNKKIYNDLNN